MAILLKLTEVLCPIITLLSLQCQAELSLLRTSFLNIFEGSLWLASTDKRFNPLSTKLCLF